MQLTDLDLAEIDIKKALEVDPDNRYMRWINLCDSQLFTETSFDFWKQFILLTRCMVCNVTVLNMNQGSKAGVQEFEANGKGVQ